MGFKIPQLSNRTKGAIQRRVSILGLHKIGCTTPNPWTPEEDNILKANFASLGTDIPQLSNRTKIAIQSRAQELGLKTNRCNKWTKEEDEILKSKYPLLGSNIPQLKHRTKGAVNTRVRILGLLETQRKNKKLLNRKYNNISGVRVTAISRQTHKYEYMFEDGIKVTIKKANPTTVTHPKLHPRKHNPIQTYFGFTTKYIYTDTDTEIWTAYYEVECQKCGLKAIMTPQQMQAHFRICNKEIHK